jgi:hypothetical protein
VAGFKAADAGLKAELSVIPTLDEGRFPFKNFPAQSPAAGYRNPKIVEELTEESIIITSLPCGSHNHGLEFIPAVGRRLDGTRGSALGLGRSLRFGFILWQQGRRKDIAPGQFDEKGSQPLTLATASFGFFFFRDHESAAEKHPLQGLEIGKPASFPGAIISACAGEKLLSGRFISCGQLPRENLGEFER